MPIPALKNTAYKLETRAKARSPQGCRCYVACCIVNKVGKYKQEFKRLYLVVDDHDLISFLSTAIICISHVVPESAVLLV